MKFECLGAKDLSFFELPTPNWEGVNYVTGGGRGSLLTGYVLRDLFVIAKLPANLDKKKIGISDN